MTASALLSQDTREENRKLASAFGHATRSGSLRLDSKSVCNVVPEPHSPSSGTKSYKCHEDSCEKRFERKRELNKHRKNHLGRESRAHKCDHCNETFVYPKDRTRHEISVHSVKTERSTTKFYCTFPACKWSKEGLVRKDKMQRHLRDVHKVENPTPAERPLVQDTPEIYQAHLFNPNSLPTEVDDWVCLQNKAIVPMDPPAPESLMEMSRSPTPSLNWKNAVGSTTHHSVHPLCQICVDFQRASSRYLNHTCQQSRGTNAIRDILFTLSLSGCTHIEQNSGSQIPGASDTAMMQDHGHRWV